MGGPSSEEKTLQKEQAQQTQQYIAQQSTLFSESQDLMKTLKPVLEAQIANPTGFSAEEMAQLNAANVNTTGAQYENVQKQINLVNANENMKGLTSGVAASEAAGVANLAAGTVASNASNIQTQSEQLAEQKRATAQSELLGLESGTAGNAISTASVENQSQSQAFQQAYQEQQQSSQLMNTIVGGLVQGGASMLGKMAI